MNEERLSSVSYRDLKSSRLCDIWTVRVLQSTSTSAQFGDLIKIVQRESSSATDLMRALGCAASFLHFLFFRARPQKDIAMGVELSNDFLLLDKLI